MTDPAPVTQPRVYDVALRAEAAFDAAADAVAAGDVIVLPTDTVYGVGADPFTPAAVQRLLDAKQRGRDMPPPVLVAEVAMVRSIARVDDRVLALADAFWPGALTLVLEAPASLRMDLGERGDTIAVRVPDHAFTRELLRRTGPLAVSSANVSGQEAALTIADAQGQLGDSIAVYLDAGAMSGPVPSTILDLSSDTPALLRAGRLTAEQINAVVPGLLPVESDPEPVAAAPTPEPASEDDATSADTPADDDAYVARRAAASDAVAPDDSLPQRAVSAPDDPAS